MFKKAGRSVRLFSYSEDQPNELRGLLIPKVVREAEVARSRSRSSFLPLVSAVGFPLMALGLFAFVAFAGMQSYGFLIARAQLASPTITIMDPATFAKVSLGYGPQVALSQDSFFTNTRDALIEGSQTFVEVDLSANMLRYFKDGVLAESTEILAVGAEGSWWDAPSGLYKVEKMNEQEFSTIAQVYLPWALTFEGNYAIHGWPEYPGGVGVEDDFTQGGIRIDTEKAKAIFESIDVGVPVLVHKKPTEIERFTYEPTVQGVTAPHYLIADIETGSILAASELDDPVPIASVTKLMTAVVAAEKMNLDSRVQVTSPTFVHSLIPRLSERASVSMYSLFQLLLTESSNEAAEVIAGEYGRDAFIAEMNRKSKQIGMLQTQFVDPSGIGPENLSTLTDLFRLAQYIHHSRQFIFDITVDGRIASISGFDEFTDLHNFNGVEDVDNLVGGKVGETMAAGKTFVSLHEVNIQGSKRTVAIVLLGSSARTQDVHTLLGFVESQYRH